MTLPLVVRPEAEADIVFSRDWYNRRRDGLGQDFVNSISELLTRIQATPDIFATSFRNCRRAKPRRFPHVVYFRLLDDRIEVLAVLHASRDPRAWQRRT